MFGNYIVQTTVSINNLTRAVNVFKVEMTVYKNEMSDFKNEARVDRNEMNKKWGDLANKMGTLAEDLAAPSIPRIIKERFGVEIIRQLVRAKSQISINGKAEQR